MRRVVRGGFATATFVLRQSFRGVPLGGALLFFVACAPPAATPPPRDVTFDTADGVALHATMYPAEAPLSDAPLIIAAHELGATRARWAEFANAAQRGGFAVLAFDIRGHGGSVMAGDEERSYRRFSQRDWDAVPEDFAAAKAWAIEAGGASPESIVFAGASVGANAALLAAAEDSSIAAVVLVSPGLVYRGLDTKKAIKRLGPVPVLLVAADGDAYSAQSSLTLKDMRDAYSELRAYPGKAHGTALFSERPGAIQDVLRWLRPIVYPSP